MKILNNQENGDEYIPLNNLKSGQPPLLVYDSFLSEYAACGFEYGYSVAKPDALVLWEAQFGDFSNGAQIIFYQFLSASPTKWKQRNSLVLLLPHGYEGQGPEHSSARLERFLQLCAEKNMSVCNFTTPANYFHALRRQVKSSIPRPLVVMSPKSLLRHKQATSTLEDLADGTFLPVIGEVEAQDPKKVKRLVLCGGKVYYDLYNRRAELEKDDVAVVRIEQLYPFPEKDLAEAIKEYTNLETAVWCQEEPMNQGAWYCTQHHMRQVLHQHDSSLLLEGVGRPASAAPAVGYISVHVEQQETLVNKAING